MKDIDQFRWLRQQLPDQNYFWFNANECANTRHTVEETISFGELDPLYVIETQQWPAQLDICTAGRKSIFMNAEGDLFACHISKIKMGNLYQQRQFSRLPGKTMPLFSRLSAPSRYSIAESPGCLTLF